MVGKPPVNKPKSLREWSLLCETRNRMPQVKVAKYFLSTVKSRFRTEVPFPLKSYLSQILIFCLSIVDTKSKKVPGTGRILEETFLKVPETVPETFGTNPRYFIFYCQHEKIFFVKNLQHK